MPVTPNAWKPHSRARSTRVLVTLPEQCELPAPKLPAGRTWAEHEQALWAELWGGPQASQWDDSYASAVAQFVVHSCAVIGGSASAWMAQEARHLGDRLGLTPQGMAALGWRLSEPGPAPAPSPLRSA